MTSFGFRVYGFAAPQGSKVPGASKSGKLFVREQAGKKLSDWRTEVKSAAIIARGDADTITSAVQLHVDFFIPRPASISVAKRPRPTVAPDLDKMIRAVGDALKEAGVYKDDSLVVKIIATKRYATDEKEWSPGAWIVVSEIL
jgi:Holliday junction resolvase RusA-like endonuclease